MNACSYNGPYKFFLSDKNVSRIDTIAENAPFQINYRNSCIYVCSTRFFFHHHLLSSPPLSLGGKLSVSTCSCATGILHESSPRDECERDKKRKNTRIKMEWNPLRPVGGVSIKYFDVSPAGFEELWPGQILRV